MRNESTITASTANATRDSRREEGKRVAIWIRVSTEDQAKGDSPEHHEERARMYAEMKGWTVVTVYHLEAVSGKSVLGHPEAERMLNDVRSGQISGLIFSKLARLARNTRELLDIADVFRDEGADLISLQESIDTSTPAGRFFYTMLGAMAQWEREETADRVSASVLIRAKLGKPLGGKTPYGYHWKDGKLTLHPEEAPIRKLAYDLFLTHKRVKTVARLLNDAGYRTRIGGLFGSTTVKRILRDQTAKGLRRANFSTSTGANGKRFAMKPEAEWVYSEVTPLVSEEVWEQANALLEERKEKPPARKPVHLFTGLAFCECGAKLYVPSNTPKWVCYKCRNKIPIVDLERVFEEQLKGFFFSEEEVARYLADGDRVLGEKRELLAVLSGERERLTVDMEKVYRLYLEDQLSPQGFGERNRPLEERARQLSEEIPRLQAEIDFLSIEHLSSEEVVSEAWDLYSRWHDLPFEEHRAIVETIVNRITVGKGEVEIDLAYLPPPSEMMAERCHSPTSTRTRWPS
jgi:site-specific DNA recombinase